MYYLMITFAALLFSVQFVFNDGYRKNCGSAWNCSLRFSMYTSLIGLIFLLCIHGWRLEVTLFSAIVAFVYAAVCVACGYLSMKALEHANLSVYSIFCMIGGMLLPFVYGLFLGEEFKPMRIACCVLITVSVCMTVNNKKKQSAKAIGYYLGVFVLNGLVGVISKFHQSHSAYCVDSESFLMLTKIAVLLMCVILLLMRKDKKLTVSKKAFGYCAGYSVVNSLGNLLLLIALLHVPASVQYPVVTGGTIVFSVLIDKLRKAEVSNKEVIAAGIALAATVFMSF